MCWCMLEINILGKSEEEDELIVILTYTAYLGPVFTLWLQLPPKEGHVITGKVSLQVWEAYWDPVVIWWWKKIPKIKRLLSYFCILVSGYAYEGGIYTYEPTYIGNPFIFVKCFNKFPGKSYEYIENWVYGFLTLLSLCWRWFISLEIPEMFWYQAITSGVPQITLRNQNHWKDSLKIFFKEKVSV